MRILAFILFCVLSVTSCTTPKKVKPPEELLSIVEIRPNRWTALTRQNLLHLFQVYDLKPILFTKTIHVQSRVIPHSHPVLTLNTRYAEDPKKLLGLMVHEQLHWWLGQNEQATKAAIIDLQKIYPVLPKKGVAKDTQSTYSHLIICYLEYRVLVKYVGKADEVKMLQDAIQVEKIYPWVYLQVLKNYKALDNVVKKHHLEPAFLLQKPTKKP